MRPLPFLHVRRPRSEPRGRARRPGGGAPAGARPGARHVHPHVGRPDRRRRHRHRHLAGSGTASSGCSARPTPPRSRGRSTCPATPPRRTPRARAEATKNGFTDGSGGVIVTPRQGPPQRPPHHRHHHRADRLVLRPGPGHHPVHDGCHSRAEYVLPVPMGSPENYYGVGYYVATSSVTNDVVTPGSDQTDRNSGATWLYVPNGARRQLDQPRGRTQLQDAVNAIVGQQRDDHGPGVGRHGHPQPAHPGRQPDARAQRGIEVRVPRTPQRRRRDRLPARAPSCRGTAARPGPRPST